MHGIIRAPAPHYCPTTVVNPANKIQLLPADSSRNLNKPIYIVGGKKVKLCHQLHNKIICGQIVVYSIKKKMVISI